MANKEQQTTVDMALCEWHRASASMWGSHTISWFGSSAVTLPVFWGFPNIPYLFLDKELFSTHYQATAAVERILPVQFRKNKTTKGIVYLKEFGTFWFLPD